MSPGLPRGPFRKQQQYLLDTRMEKTGQRTQKNGWPKGRGSLVQGWESRRLQPPALAQPSVGLPAPPGLPSPQGAHPGFFQSLCPPPLRARQSPEVCPGTSVLTFSPSCPGGPGSPISPWGQNN